MNEQTSDKHNAVKEFLGSDEYVTFIDVLLRFPTRVLQKLTHQERGFPFYWSAALLCISILVIGYGLSALWGDINSANIKIIRIEFLGVFLAYLSLIIFKNARDSVIETIRNHVIDEIDDENSLQDLNKWLRLFANKRVHLIFCLIYATGFSFGLREEFTGYGSSFIVFSTAFIWGIPMYFLLTFIFLPYRMGKYKFRIYSADPGSSTIIINLSRLFQGLVYLYAIVAAGSMIFIAYSGLLPSLALPSLFVAWLPIIALFVINQYALSNIITKGKYKTLMDIQTQVENIQKSERLAEKEVMDKVVRLMDYHDRVKATKNVAFDLRAGLDFLNSLLLPVVGFFIGNIDINSVMEIAEDIKSRLIQR